VSRPESGPWRLPAKPWADGGGRAGRAGDGPIPSVPPATAVKSNPVVCLCPCWRASRRLRLLRCRGPGRGGRIGVAAGRGGRRLPRNPVIAVLTRARHWETWRQRCASSMAAAWWASPAPTGRPRPKSSSQRRCACWPGAAHPRVLEHRRGTAAHRAGATARKISGCWRWPCARRAEMLCWLASLSHMSALVTNVAAAHLGRWARSMQWRAPRARSLPSCPWRNCRVAA